MTNVTSPIILIRTPTCWLLRDPDNAEILDLFGTDTLPLPWTAHAPQAVVLADMQQRHPGRAIIVQGTESVVLFEAAS